MSPNPVIRCHGFNQPAPQFREAGDGVGGQLDGLLALSGCVTFLLANEPLPDECQIISKGLAFPAHQISDLVSFVTVPIPGRPAVDQPVIDRTGLDGYFRMVIRYEPIGATLLQQMQEQLGLKLTPAREAVDVLVIDSATTPKVD